MSVRFKASAIANLIFLFCQGWNEATVPSGFRIWKFMPTYHITPEGYGPKTLIDELVGTIF